MQNFNIQLSFFCNLPQKTFSPKKVSGKLGGSVHAIYQKCRVIILNFPLNFLKKIVLFGRVLHVYAIYQTYRIIAFNFF